jgi:hypothetical protein
MTTQSSWAHHFRSAALVLAGLLHLLSVPAEPVVHGWLHAAPNLPGWVSNDAGTSGALLHQEQACVVCQGLNEHALPEPGAAPIASVARAFTPRAVGEPRPTSVVRARLQARAPPA